jgi:hypothetical protein
VTEDDPLAGFDPDEALEEIRSLCSDRWPEDGDPLVERVRQLDHWLLVGERLPAEWAHPEPAVIAERFMRKQPRRTSREERRR